MTAQALSVELAWGVAGVHTLRQDCDVLVLVDILSFTTAVSVAVSGAYGAAECARESAAIRLKMSPRNSSSSLVKPMMFTSGERRSWLTM